MDETLTPISEEMLISAEDAVENQILVQLDATELSYSEPDASLPGIIWTARESVTVGKRVTSIYKYYELRDKGAVIGRQLNAIEKVITDYGIPVDITQIQIVGYRERGE